MGAPLSTSGPFVIPPTLRDGMRRFGSMAWLEGLPATVDEAADRWGLEVGEPFLPGGLTSWVAPARTAEGRELVLKITWVHFEGLHEAEGLTVWDGHGAVRLEASADFEAARGLLLERCVPGSPLAGREEADQDIVIAGLLQPFVDGADRRAFRSDPWPTCATSGRIEFEQKVSSRPVDLDSWPRSIRHRALPGASTVGRPCRTPVHRPACRERARCPARAVADDRPEALRG